MSSFKIKYLKGEVTFDKINDFIEEWHSTPSIKLTLQEFLGLTEDEYQTSTNGLSHLKKILDSQKYKAVANYSKAIDKHYKDAK